MIWAFSDESERAATMLFGVLLIEPGAVAASHAGLAELRLPGQRSWAACCETEWSPRGRSNHRPTLSAGVGLDDLQSSA